MKVPWAFLICLVLTALAVQTCVRIEILNAQAGGRLPMQGEGKWRAMGGKTYEECILRMLKTEAELADKPFTLTDAQKQEIAEGMKQADANCRLRDLVGSWGLLQYVVAPAAFCLGMAVVANKQERRRTRIGASFLAGAAATCVVFMFARAYFTSLGW